jgi:hypothetical protein
MKENHELFQRDKEFSKLVKKARRKSLLRNIFISTSVSVLLFCGLFWIGTFLMYRHAEATNMEDYMWQFVKGANVENSGSIYTNTPFSTTVTTERFKEIGGVPIPWGQHEKVFSIFGTSRVVQASMVSSSGSINDNRIPLYFQGERVVEFYYPAASYSVLPNDRDILDEIPNHQVVEMAFSFDREYTINEVSEKFSDLLAWYWVDAANEVEKEGEQTPVSGEEAFGFASRIEETNEEAASMFIHHIEWLKSEEDSPGEAESLYNALFEGGEIEASPETLKITGAVVTGTAEELKEFNGEPMIRTAVLGATASKY